VCKKNLNIREKKTPSIKMELNLIFVKGFNEY